MQKEADIRALLAKAIRIVLVFALVFGISLRCEYLIAYGYGAVVVDDGTAHEDETLTDLVIYESAAGEDTWAPVPHASALSTTSAQVELSSDKGSREFAVTPIWDGAYPLGYGEGAYQREVANASFVDWQVDDPAGCLEHSVGPNNVLNLNATANGTATVRCVLQGHRSEDLSLAFSVVASVPEPEPIRELKLTSVDICNSDGGSFPSSPQITLKKDELPADYQLQIKVGIENLPGHEGVVTYDSMTDGTLSEFSEGVIGDVEWTVSDTEIASVNPSGLMKVTEEGMFRVTAVVRCLSADLQAADSIEVVAGDPEATDDPQGASHPQNSLRILAEIPAMGGSAGGTGDGSTEGQEGEGSSDDGEGQEGVSIDRSYSIDELRTMTADGTLSLFTQEYSMRNSDGTLKIEGEGVDTLSLIENAFSEVGANTANAPIDSVDFIDYRGIRTRITWTQLQGLSSQMAFASRVLVDDEADEEGDGASDELVDNSRFRLLFDSSSSKPDADSLRWLNTIQLNMKTVDTDRLAVGVSYVPVPMGVEAEFIASPNHNINGRWDCQWERSTDGGETWEVLDGAINQTLRVMTSSQTVGNLYRVTIDNSTSISSGDATEHLTATSKPVELQVGTGFAVVLSYNPPKAGELAIFRSSIYDYDGDAAKLSYVWEWSDDGGSSWSVIKNADKPTYKVQTKAVEDTEGEGGGDESETPNLVYIRVRAITPDDQVSVSNAQPLTVHVGDADTDTNPGDDPDGNANGSAADPGSQPGATTPGTSTVGPSRPVVTPVNPVVEATGENNAALDPDGTQTTPDASSSPQIYINDEISAQIEEQNQKIEQAMNETVPGARWTALKTLNPTGDEISRVLADNPFAPFVIPFALGLLVAGALEKFISYRRAL